MHSNGANRWVPRGSFMTLFPASRFHTILAVSRQRHRSWAAEDPTALRRQPADRIGHAHELAAAVGSLLDLDLALGKPFRADQNLPGNADQVGRREFAARPLVAIVVEHLDALAGELAVELLAGG